MPKLSGSVASEMVTKPENISNTGAEGRHAAGSVVATDQGGERYGSPPDQEGGLAEPYADTGGRGDTGPGLLISPPDSGPGASPTDNTPTTAPTGTSGGTPAPARGGFEIDRVSLFDPADLPVADVPVPVPWGGEARYLEDFTSGATVLLVNYDAQFFRTAAAFYQTWIAQEGLEVTASTTLPTFARWTVVIDGEEVTIEVNQSSERAQLTVTFGGD